ncbi:hypothetical protein NDU88_004627 [Pleurodeles waltl]|uniref:Uncharacterized protein n=1 Tax=Pleurodeles waltl TaxID=8319 RepID=A0AAV7UHA6_PLEWA|nr:hypothetical protein NDU88_004627 [Pleurodeles waltl]
METGWRIEVKKPAPQAMPSPWSYGTETTLEMREMAGIRPKNKMRGNRRNKTCAETGFTECYESGGRSNPVLMQTPRGKSQTINASMDDTTYSRAVEWEAHKVALRGECMAKVVGVRIELERGLTDLEMKQAALGNHPIDWPRRLLGITRWVEEVWARLDKYTHTEQKKIVPRVR